MHVVARCALAPFLAALAFVPVAWGQNVTGRAIYSGPEPRAVSRAVNKDPEVCGHEPRPFFEVRLGEDQGLRDVVVILEDFEGEVRWNHPEGGYVLEQKGCNFEPYLMVFPRDPRARLKIVNSDATLHNVRISQLIGRAKATLLNLSQPEGAPIKERPLRLRSPEPVIELKCDAHDFMQGWMYVADHPYYTIVDDDGAFTLPDLPPGEHTLRAWHPYLGTVTETVQVTEGAAVTVDFSFAAKSTQ